MATRSHQAIAREEAAAAVPPPKQLAAAINAQLKGPALRVGAEPVGRLRSISSGFPAIDKATGLGGFPRGRMTELIGRPTSGRETIAARAVAAADGYGAWVDVAGLVDVAHLAHCGISLERLFILHPKKVDHALALAAQLLTARHFSIVVIDSLADLEPGGATSRAVGQFVRVVTPALGRSATVAIALSSPENHYRPLAHASALRISLMKVGLLRRGGVLRGWRTRARILKSPGRPGGESCIEVWL